MVSVPTGAETRATLAAARSVWTRRPMGGRTDRVSLGGRDGRDVGGERGLGGCDGALVDKTQRLVQHSRAATEAAKRSAGAAENSVAAMQEQVALQRDQLRLYYEPGLAVQVHDALPEGLLVKAFPVNQCSVFGVRAAWGHAGTEFTQNMALHPEARSGDAHNELKPHVSPKWNAARIASDQVGWCLLPGAPDGSVLKVTWRHIGGWVWTQDWSLRKLSPTGSRWALEPQGTSARKLIAETPQATAEGA